MKKRLITVFLAVAMALACVIGLVACGDDEKSSVNGTYEMWIATSNPAEQGTCTKMPSGAEIVLKDGRWTQAGQTFTYIVEDGNIVLGNLTYKKKDNYYYSVTAGGQVTQMLCKQGETPKGYTVAE